MTRKTSIKILLICAIAALSLGGWLLHLRIHPAEQAAYGWVPLISGMVSVFILPLLFWFRSTLAFAYVINGFSVILGTIVMAHFSLAHFTGPLTLSSLLLGTLFGDIAILWGKFAVGKAIFDLELMRTDQDLVSHGRYFRYPNMGWWWVHLIAWAAVYALGAIFWK